MTSVLSQHCYKARRRCSFNYTIKNVTFYIFIKKNRQNLILYCYMLINCCNSTNFDREPFITNSVDNQRAMVLNKSVKIYKFPASDLRRLLQTKTRVSLFKAFSQKILILIPLMIASHIKKYSNHAPKKKLINPNLTLTLTISKHHP